MVNRITILGFCVATLGAATAPHAAAAADYYDGGRHPYAYHGQDEGAFDGDPAGAEDLRPARPHRGYGPGPVVFDDRGPGPAGRYDGPAYRHGGPAYGRPLYGERRPVAVEDPAFGETLPLDGPRFNDPEGPAFGGGGGPYRAASVYRDAEGPGFGERAGAPDEGCTVEESRSTTPAGWRKTVTHRTCYRR